MPEGKGRKKEGEWSLKNQSYNWFGQRGKVEGRERSTASQAGFSKYSHRGLSMGMATENRSSRRQQTGKMEALCRAENIFSHKHWAMKTAETQQPPPFPLSDPGKCSRNKWPRTGFTLELVFKIFPLSVNLQTVAFFQIRGPAVACWSSRDIWQSFRTVKIPASRVSLPMETDWPCGSHCRPPVLIPHRTP